MLVAAATSFSLVARGVNGSERDVRTVFFVAKSENRNQVHYGLHLDAHCAPAGATPVFAYWHMLERGPFATEPLLSREVPAYGIAEQAVLDRTEHGGRVRVRLRALPGRDLLVETTEDGSTCAARAVTAIDGVPARLESVFAQLRWPFGLDHLELTGHALGNGRVVRERFRH